MDLSRKMKTKTSAPFPIFSVKEGIIKDLNGKESFLYKVVAKDQEQMDQSDVEQLYREVTAFFKSISSLNWIKFYKRGFDLYLNTNIKDISLNWAKVTLVIDPINRILGDFSDLNDINFYENYLTIGDEFLRMLYLEEITPALHENIYDKYNTDYLVSLKKIQKEISKKRLSHSRKKQSLGLATEHRNHEGEAAYQSVDTMLDSIVTGDDALFKVGVWFIVRGESLDEVNKKTLTLHKSIKEDSGKSFLEEKGLDYYFTGVIPGVRPVLSKSLLINSLNLSLILPLNRSWLHDKGLPLFDMDWMPILYDFLHGKNSNFNTLITGESGEGKSFFLGALLYFLREQYDVNLGIFDLGGSIKRIVLYNDGVNLTQKFNPFQFKDDKYLLNFFLAAIGEKLSNKERGMLHSAIKDSLALDTVNNFDEFVWAVNDRFPDVKYYFSEMWPYFTKEAIEAPEIFYVDIEGMPENIVAPYLVFAKKLSESRNGITIDVFDECFSFLDKCPDIISEKVRTGRKNLRANIFAVQEIDAFSNQYKNAADSILGNTYTKIFFHQPTLNHPIFKKFDIDVMENYVKSSKGEFSTFYICNPNFRKVCHFKANNFVYELCHTEKEEKEKQERYLKEKLPYMSYQESFQKWMEFKYA